MTSPRFRLSRAFVMFSGVLLGGILLNSVAMSAIKARDYLKQVEANSAVAAELETESEQAQFRVYQKVRIVQELLAKEITFDEALAQFEMLNRGSMTMDSFKRCCPTATDREIAARNLLQYIQKNLPPDCPQAAGEFLEWEAVFQSLFPHARPAC